MSHEIIMNIHENLQRCDPFDCAIWFLKPWTDKREEKGSYPRDSLWRIHKNGDTYERIKQPNLIKAGDHIEAGHVARMPGNHRLAKRAYAPRVNG